MFWIRYTGFNEKIQITLNLSLDGVLDVLNSKNMTNAGLMNLIDDDGSDVKDVADEQTRVKSSYDLPGAVTNRGRPIVRIKCLRIAPTGRSWSAATTEGVLVYSMDENFIFDPTDLDIDVTPEVRKFLWFGLSSYDYSVSHNHF